MQPWHFSTWLDLADHWQSLIAGVFALFAGVVAYKAGKIQAEATTQAAQDQIAANDRKDRVQAHCIAVGIYPELLHVKVSHERATRIVQVEFKKNRPALTAQIVSMVRQAAIFEPPLLQNSVGTLYLLGEAGATILQLLSVIMQYNHMVETISQQLAENVERLANSDPLADLNRHLALLADLSRKAEQEIAPIHEALLT